MWSLTLPFECGGSAPFVSRLATSRVTDTAGPGNFGLMHSGSGISAIELPEGARAAFLLIEARAPQGGGF